MAFSTRYRLPQLISQAARSLTTPVGAPYNGTSEIVIALGTNQGNRVTNLLNGLSALAAHNIEVARVSLLYETAPMYVMEQPAFLNAAVLARTDLPPLQLLYHCKQIEKQAGRDLVGGPRWGPRPLDLDIIFYGAQVVTHESLRVPHISWQQRAFVKAPMADLLLPEDIQRGYIYEPHPTASVLDWLLQAVQQWEAEGGEAQVGKDGLSRVLPIHRQIWELGRSTHICGILNITPDSFSDGGRFTGLPAQQQQQAAAAGRRQQEQQQGQKQPPRQQQPDAALKQQTPAAAAAAATGTILDAKQPTSEPPQQPAGAAVAPASTSPASAAAPGSSDTSSSSSSTSSTAGPAAMQAAPAAQPVTVSTGQPAAGGPSSGPAAPASVTDSPSVDVAGAVEAARRMPRAGAAVIDVGGQSTRPGSQRISVDEELARVLPVIRALREDSELVHVPVSIDTFHSRVAAEAVWAGADMVNDVSGGLQDAAMLSTVARLGVPYCIMHMRGDFSTMTQHPQTTYACVWAEVGTELKMRAQAAVAAGVLPWNIILDPGIGFSKTSEGNTELLGHLVAMRREQLRGVWGRMPLLVGPSRKRFIGRLTGRHDPSERDLGTAAACVAAVAQGADIVRVHNVPVVEEALRVADAVFRGTWPVFDE